MAEKAQGFVVFLKSFLCPLCSRPARGSLRRICAGGAAQQPRQHISTLQQGCALRVEREKRVHHKALEKALSILRSILLYRILHPYPVDMGRKRGLFMRAEKQDVFKRLNYIEGHLNGIRKMVEEDKYCVDILRQTYAVRKAIEKLEAIILENHLHTCVPEGISSGKTETVIDELVQLYNLAANR